MNGFGNVSKNGKRRMANSEQRTIQMFTIFCFDNLVAVVMNRRSLSLMRFNSFSFINIKKRRKKIITYSWDSNGINERIIITKSFECAYIIMTLNKKKKHKNRKQNPNPCSTSNPQIQRKMKK